MIIDKDLMVNALDYAADHPAMPKETCEMYALRTTLENRAIVLALTKAEAAVVLTALQLTAAMQKAKKKLKSMTT